MYASISGEKYDLEQVNMQNGIELVFSDTPVEDVDELARRIPECGIFVYSDLGELLLRFNSLPSEREIRKNPYKKEVSLRFAERSSLCM